MLSGRKKVPDQTLEIAWLFGVVKKCYPVVQPGSGAKF